MRHAKISTSDVARLSDLTKREIQVYLYLALCKDPAGFAFPSRKTIGAGTGIIKQNVGPAIAGLIAKGWIVEDGARFEVLGPPEKVIKSITETTGKSNQIDYQKVIKSITGPDAESNQIDYQSNQIDYSPLKESLITKIITIPVGAEAAEKTDDKTFIFSIGLDLLTRSGKTEKQSRPILGKFRSKFGDHKTAEAIREAVRIDATEPVEYISKILHRLPDTVGKSYEPAEPDWTPDPGCFLCEGTGTVRYIRDPRPDAPHWAREGPRDCPDCSPYKLKDGEKLEIIGSGKTPISADRVANA